MSDPTKAVFLSYASQDAEAAKKICDALRGAGVEVWFDAEGGLEHGDEWDAKIRRQIKECVLFLPVISANTQAREEGYFRIEWELAAQRALGIASGVAFILPVVIDHTRQPDALVPDRFRSVQWTKLPGGAVPADVLQRFLKLWSHRSGALKHAAAGAAETAAEPARSPRRSNAKPYILAAVAILILAPILYLALRPRRSPEDIAKIVAAAQALGQQEAAKAAAAAPLSEARQLALRARAMSFDKYDSTADDFTAAESLLKHALELDPNDAEIWAVSSQLNKQFQTRGFDRANARAAAALSQAQRAVKLDPDSIEAQFALGFAERGTDPIAAEQIMRKILARQPDHAGALFAMSNLAFRRGQVEESLGYLEKVGTQPKSAALAGYLKYLTYFSRARFAEADQAIRGSIAVQPSANSVAGLAMVLLTWKGDAEAAARMFAEAPTTMRNEPRTVWMTAQVQLCHRAPEEALNALDRLPDDFIQDSWFSAPKAYYVGRAQALAGRPEAARVAWEAGLTIMQARLKSAPANPDLHLVNGELLALLGRDDEALREARTVTELSRGQKLPWFASPVRIYAELGRADDAMPLLAGLCPPQVGDNVGWPLTPALLRLDPIWDKIRNDPRFQQLCAEPAPVTPVTDSPSAVAGPQDPELKRALQLINSPEAIASDITLAEDITKSVLATRPTDTDATIVMGRIQVYCLVRGFDRSEDRFATAKHYAERALALAPDDPDAQAVMATYLYRRNVDLPRAEKLLRAAIAQRPAEPLYYRMLDNVLSDEPGVTDAAVIASAKVTAERFPVDALVQYELARHYRDAGMLEESEHYLDIAIKLGPVANAIIARARLNLFVHGDPAAMKALLDTLPDRYHGTDRAVFSQFSYALATRQPELGLDALQVLPEAWMIDFDYTGPTALLAGELLLQEDKAELARLRFTEALAELGRHKPDFSRNFSTTWLETWLLMRLGRLDEARKRNDVFFPELTRPFHMNLGTNWWFNPITLSLLLGEPAKALALMHEAVDFPQGRAIFRNALRLDPRMAPFRDDPEIKALLAEPSVANAMDDRPAAVQVTEDGRQGNLATLPAADPKSVAVLAFANLSDDKENEYFSDGISEELLTVLQKIPGLHVAARTSSFFFKGREATAQEIGAKLGVATLVEGSVRKAGNSVRITARLSRAATGEQLWSESYTRDLKDVFAVQSELAETIVGQLRGQLGGAAAKAEIQAQVQAAELGGTRNVQAHELYLQGKYFLNRVDLADNDRATALLQRAADLDPSFALAWAALSEAGWFRGGYGNNREDFDAGWALARTAADKAIAAEPRLAAGLIARFDIVSSVDFDWKASREWLRRAQALAPNDATVIHRASQLAFTFGEADKAVDLARQAAALDPVNAKVYISLGYFLVGAHHFEAAVAAFRQVYELSPDAPWGHAGVSMVRVAQGRGDEAVAEAEQESTEWSRLYTLALARWCQKKKPEADAALAQFIKANADVAAYQIASVYAYRGEADQAFEWLERAYRQRDPGLGWSKADYFLERLRPDPRWPVFLKKMGLADDQLK